MVASTICHAHPPQQQRPRRARVQYPVIGFLAARYLGVVVETTHSIPPASRLPVSVGSMAPSVIVLWTIHLSPVDVASVWNNISKINPDAVPKNASQDELMLEALGLSSSSSSMISIGAAQSYHLTT